MNRGKSSPSVDRISVLERRLRRQGWIIRCGFLVLGFAFIAGANRDGFEEIKARRFVVNDENDKPRGLLTSHHGATVLSLFDSTGAARARFSVLEDGHPEMTLLNESGKALIRLAEREGAVQLYLTDGRGLGKVVLGQCDNQFGVDVSNPDGLSGVRLRSDLDQPQLAIIGAEGGGAVQAFALGNESGVSVFGSNGKLGTSLKLLDNLRPSLLLQDDEKKTEIVPQGPTAARPRKSGENKYGFPE